MRTFAGAVTASLIGVAAFSGAASADNFFELEHARANARAGGPVSERDAELLDRYGALSGTGNWRARAPAPYNDRSEVPPARAERKHKPQRP